MAETQGINIWMRYRARWFKPAWLYWFKTKNSRSSLLYMAPKLSLGKFRTSSPYYGAVQRTSLPLTGISKGAFVFFSMSPHNEGNNKHGYNNVVVQIRLGRERWRVVQGKGRWGGNHIWTSIFMETGAKEQLQSRTFFPERHRDIVVH